MQLTNLNNISQHQTMSKSTDTTAASPSANEPPVRANMFFTHLNLDVRCMIYDLLELPPVGNTNIGFILSCKQAYTGAETAAVRGFNRLLKKTEAEMVELETNGGRDETPGARLDVSLYPSTSKFSDLRNLRIGVSWPIIQRPVLAKQLLGCHLSKLTLVAIGSDHLRWGDNRDYELQPMDKHDFFFEVHRFFCLIAMHDSCLSCGGFPFRFNRYKAKCIELIWGNHSTQTTPDTVYPTHFGFQNHTAKEKAEGRMVATVTDFVGHERGSVLLEYDGPWKVTFDDNQSYQLISDSWRKLWNNLLYRAQLVSDY
ncbi:hypothetical protein PtrSN002B_005090 [Pyrenophora tritici-repentis]|uniref:Uncharacterized protein n=3 Tax=Pyrenophora tritici-repentis TaxID=45151 RepID=A0A2W1G811_9PLEO|nr:hypothetical protein PtrV1_09744 [Pyrenophora tritici-repentis]KAF7442802.1 hypothetical protein A1F99_123090 [Pyrenophora tritici-repentis]KAF7568742.1 hypothetical protein PtrM4_133550 [Pyrenophora tritici-repentis]KAG9376318.1 hypothetical protein A1F94_012865 [Pyrenophora tritici-repentis]KAI0571514.1 hypothetical protein Alg130_10854 [Pyrenophora tritici-repentis]